MREIEKLPHATAK
jgi:hypothetical protein